MFLGKQAVWIIHGDGWSLPVEIFWYARMGRVQLPDIPLTRPMREALQSVVVKYGVHNGKDWWMGRETLEMIGDEMPSGSDPEELIHWTRHTGRRIRLEQPEEMTGFFEELAACGCEKITTPGEAQIVWGFVIRHMFNWLVGQKKPVHLGFATLHPLPFRPYWTMMLLYRFRGLVMHYTSGKGTNLKDSGATQAARIVPHAYRAASERIKKWLIDDRFLMVKNDLCHWTLHVKHLAPWWKAMFAIEKDRRKRMKGLAYFLDMREEMKDRADQAHEIFRDQASQARIPYPKIHVRAGGSRKGKRPDYREIKSIGPTSSVHLVFDERTGRRVPPSIKKASGLSRVSAVRPGTKDVRSEGTGLEQPGDEQA